MVEAPVRERQESTLRPGAILVVVGRVKALDDQLWETQWKLQIRTFDPLERGKGPWTPAVFLAYKVEAEVLISLILHTPTTWIKLRLVTQARDLLRGLQIAAPSLPLTYGCIKMILTLP